MIFIVVQSVFINPKSSLPFSISCLDSESGQFYSYTFRIQATLPAKLYQQAGLNRGVIINSPPFCDLADELIEVFENKVLVFSDSKQFYLLKAQFKTIGYNFHVRPKYLFSNSKTEVKNPIEEFLDSRFKPGKQDLNITSYAIAYLEMMQQINENNADCLNQHKLNHLQNAFDFSSYKKAPGVYYFLDESKDVIYVGKAKNIRKRLQNHFSSHNNSGIDYSEVKIISVEYCGNDILAQLIESANIKALKPLYNTQQLADPAPYLINKSTTAGGIKKLHIIRKDVDDTMPEKYFNRASVWHALNNFCTTYQLCRKHCGIEKVKGPCSNVTVKNQPCVCAGDETIIAYNRRFDIAFYNFKNYKDRKIYKLKGRSSEEDAFIYVVNGIYEGYGFIDKDVYINGINDILGHLNRQINNYDTSRIINGLDKLVPKENIINLSSH